MTIGDRLDQAMKAAEIESQSALARASGVPQATISRILKGGSKKGPETETIRKLAAACNVSFEWLNEGIGPASRSEHEVSQPLKAVPLVREAAANEEVTADEILELIAAYKATPPKQRAIVLAGLKQSMKLASHKKNQGGQK